MSKDSGVKSSKKKKKSIRNVTFIVSSEDNFRQLLRVEDTDQRYYTDRFSINFIDKLLQR